MYFDSVPDYDIFSILLRINDQVMNQHKKP